MKTFAKLIIGLLVLVTWYSLLGTASATCTLPGNQCNDGESCDVPAGCSCFGASMALNDTCRGTTASSDDSVVATTAISGDLITYSFTITNNVAARYFLLELPNDPDYGIEYVASSQTPENTLLHYPIFLINAGETKTITITGKVVAPYRTFLPMSATGSIYGLYDGNQLQQLIGEKISTPTIDPIPYITISKTLTGSLPKFSGDIVNYLVTLTNVGSLGELDLLFLEWFPTSYLATPVATFNGTIQNYSSFISPDLYVWSGAYLVLNPGQSIDVSISSRLKNSFPGNTLFTNIAGFTTGTAASATADHMSSATGIVTPYADLIGIQTNILWILPELSGDAVKYQITYTNSGNISLTGVQFTYSISGTDITNQIFNLPDTSAGATGAQEFTGLVNANYAPGTPICLSGYLTSSSETGPTTNNRIAPTCYNIDAVADMTITQQLDPSVNINALASGSQILYDIIITNTGSESVTGATITREIPSSLSATTTTRNLGLINAGQSVTIHATGTITSYPNNGIDIVTTGSVSTPAREISSINNMHTLTTTLPGFADVYITKTLLSLSGFRAGIPVVYAIDYGNSGGRPASGVVITDTPSSLITIPTTSRNINTLAAGETGTIILTGILASTLNAGTQIGNTAQITTTTTQLSTTNDASTATGTIQIIDGVYVDMIVNNITRTQLDNPPYGTDQNTMIQAVSGDTIRLTIFYGNDGNLPITNASISLGSINGLTPTQTINGNLGNLAIDASGTMIIDAIVGPQNFILISPVATLSYNTNLSKTDTLQITEPLACGDGLVTQTEVCDTNGPVGNIALGQECENQQGSCVLVTKFIVNNACVNFDYTNPVSGYGTGQSCSSIAMPVTQPSCSSLTQDGNTFTCNAQNSTANTIVSIYCDGALTSGYCAGGTVTCMVGSETSASEACTINMGTPTSACEVVLLDGDMIILDEDGNGSMPVVCEDNNGDEIDNAEIDCGPDGEYDDGVCTYDGVEGGADLITISCEGAGNVSCETELIIDQGFLADCGNGHREGYEQCDDGNNHDGDGCSRNCAREDDYTPPACFSINNGNISVQLGEQLPFRWRLETKKSELSSKNANCNPGDINKDTMECTFAVRNGKGQKTLSKTFKCNENERQGKLFDYFTTTYADSVNNAFGKYAFDVDDNFTDGIFGEYKLSLEKVSYEYCDADGDRQDSREEVDRVCEVNFAVTKPYLAQRSAFGVTPKGTNIDLDNFYNIEGKKIVTSTDLDKIMTIDANDYEGGNKIRTQMDDFITKYEKLAVEVNVQKPAGVTKVKKVPNQNIFIFEGNGANVPIGGEFSKVPFTLITKGINLVISGNLNVNGMFLVSDGNIIFDNSDLCSSGSQEVRGIFVVDNTHKFMSDSLANTNANRPRCNYGGLYVKGVLIGDGIDDLVKSRRSQLNTRFYLKSENENNQKAQRRNKIFNGAAVLIEYSPSLRAQLPPGASDFTKALEVYKK